jgi:predicted lipoprotein with Yx(FWY)xxD motif
MARLSILALCVAAIVAAGCGSDDESSTASAAQDTATREDAAKATTGARKGKRAKGKRIKAIGSSYGRVIADRRGEAFYLFDRDRRGKSRCYGACARAWPPAITRGKPRAGNGVKARLLGTTRRKNGKLQATYAGHPLYYYVDDSPGRILCQNVSEFGGLWLVVEPSGEPVT